MKPRKPDYKIEYSLFPVKVITDPEMNKYKWVWTSSYILFEGKRYELVDEFFNYKNYYEILHKKRGETEWFEVVDTLETFYKNMTLRKTSVPANFSWARKKRICVDLGDGAFSKELATREDAEKAIQELINRDKKIKEPTPQIVEVSRTRYP